MKNSYQQVFTELVALVDSLSISSARGKLLSSSRSSLAKGDFYFIGFNPGGDPELETISVIDNLKSTPEKDWTEFTHVQWYSNKSLRPAGTTARQKRVIKLFDEMHIDIHKTMITNALFVRTPDVQQMERHPLYRKYLADSAAIHGFMIDIVRPKVVVAFGGKALDAFLAHERADGFKDRTQLCSTRGDYEVIKIPHFAFRGSDDEFFAKGRVALIPHVQEESSLKVDPDDLEAYPIAIIQDRYAGLYSGGEWLAIANATKLENGAYRIIRSLEDGPHGEDTDAVLFWQDPPDWIAVGGTPEKALLSLKALLGRT